MDGNRAGRQEGGFDSRTAPKPFTKSDIMIKGSCLLCDRFKPVAPNDWKPSYVGEEFDIHDLRKVMRDTNGHHRIGFCTLTPVYGRVPTNHSCSQYQPVKDALMSVNDFIWGSWKERERDETVEKAAALLRQLKAARKISRARLERIRRLVKQVKEMRKAT